MKEWGPSRRVEVESFVRCCDLILPVGAVIASFPCPSPNRVWIVIRDWPAGVPPSCEVGAFLPGEMPLIGTMHKLKASTFRRITEVAA